MPQMPLRLICDRFGSLFDRALVSSIVSFALDSNLLVGCGITFAPLAVGCSGILALASCSLFSRFFCTCVLDLWLLCIVTCQGGAFGFGVACACATASAHLSTAFGFDFGSAVLALARPFVAFGAGLSPF